ncbi:M61 family metallopeptidase [Pedobacter boryungensis]|uniref:M61 family metallopeptidase n=1 Tax=Pedobacter boryungensis TaxID=869962 RepID=A0ABX2DEE8_9SPHI|nr:PDZ domain-containing protein [Pedobacter boryungensis]NQX32462.1 M61 family metallopeptidase [Pedobacter boryungensis]
MKISFLYILFLGLIVFNIDNIKAQQKTFINYTVSMENPEQHKFQVSMETTITETSDFVMPIWTPGYYQKMNFAQYVSDFDVRDKAGSAVTWKKRDENTWTISADKQTLVTITYNVKATRAFVASSYLGIDRGYIIPGALFLYPEGKINEASKVQIKPINNWTVATGLLKLKDKPFTYYASDYDILYDSPLLVGPLESLPSFTVKGIPHYFVGYKMGDFDKEKFIADVKKIVESASDLIGHIPYQDYTFIAIGPGQGGIEHLNSTTISFDGGGLTTADGRNKLYNFIAHEYFHHYNVKRIRPIELGPFDYKKGSRTNMLWVSEGLSVYYEYLVVKRAGLMTEGQLYDNFKNNIIAFENKPGRHFQSLIQASYNTWSDGPFGRNEDEINRTISYYDKGPVVGMLLDFKIRNATNNQKSLDDVMRKMYTKYYQQLKRGFTEAEFRTETEKIAGTDLTELFEYTTTTKELDYQKYLNYAGLNIDTVTRVLPTSYTGIKTRMRNDSLVVSNVDYESPAWIAGIRNRDVILTLGQTAVNVQSILDIEKNKKANEIITFNILQGGVKKEVNLKLENKLNKSFTISRKENLTELQRRILESWLTKN